MGVYIGAGLTAQVPIIKPAQIQHKTVQTHRKNTKHTNKTTLLEN
jgi:hypothetical protein